MSRADMSSSHNIISHAFHDWHGWAVGILAGGIASLDPNLTTFLTKLAFGGAMAFTTGMLYTAGHIIVKKFATWLEKKKGQ